MKQGDMIFTPRFCTVKISAIYENIEQAKLDGYTEPTYYEDSGYNILGKSIEINRMTFAAVKKNANS